MPGWLLVVVSGTVVMLVALYFILVCPWYMVGLIVEHTQVPRAQFSDVLTSCWPRRSFAVKADGAVWILGEELREVEPQEVEGTIRRWRASKEFAHLEAHEREWRLGIRGHRDAPWSVVRELIDAAARSGETSVFVSMAPYGDLRLIFIDVVGPENTSRRGQPRIERFLLDKVPLERADLAREKVVRLSREAADQGDVYRPIVRLALAEDPQVGDVLNSLECYVVDLDLVMPDKTEYGRRGVCVTGMGTQ
jgi:hypothetical protein